MTNYSIAPVRFSSVSMVTATLGANDPEIGTRVQEGALEYVFVYNAGGEEIPASYGAVPVGGATSPYSVTITSVAGAKGVGVCRNATITTATYGWLVYRGITEIEIGASGTVTTGKSVKMLADGAFGGDSAVAGAHIGNAINTIVSGASGDAYVAF